MNTEILLKEKNLMKNLGMINLFNQMQGKLRISITHACQLECQFCHREGIDQHWMPIHITSDFLGNIVHAYSSMGGKYIELTGGEPLCHPEIQHLIEIASFKSKHLSICTNGLLLGKIQKQLKAGLVQQIKLSLHATSNSEAAKSLLGADWDIDTIKSNVNKVLETKTPLQLIYTHTRKNSSSLPAVLELALKWKADLQVIDLISSRNCSPEIELGYVSGDESEQIIARYAKFKSRIYDRTGSVLKLYEGRNGSIWEIKDYHYGLFHSKMCYGCKQINQCGEGVYALRVDSLGVFKPCLLRKDLELIVDSTRSNTDTLTLIMQQQLYKMLEI